MGDDNKSFYLRLVLGVGCIVVGVAAGQIIDQRLMLVAMFPAVALLSGVIASLTAPRGPKTKQPPPLSAAEKELLAAVWNSGELDPASAAETTSLPEADADRVLSELARKGYLKTVETGGERVYTRAAG